jgi:hypothetical protein
LLPGNIISASTLIPIPLIPIPLRLSLGREAQQLARHSTPELTANIYGRTRNERLIEVTDKVTDMVLFGEVGVNVVHKTEQDAIVANDKSLQTKTVILQYGNWRRGDSNPLDPPEYIITQR